MKFSLGERLTGLPKRIQGLRFVASDIDYDRGEGELIQGNAQHLLTALLGRTYGLDLLKGNGVPILGARIG